MPYVLSVMLGLALVFEPAAPNPAQAPTPPRMQAQVRQDLLAVNGGQFLDGLQLDDDAVIDEEIDTQTLVEGHPVVLESHVLLPLDLEPLTHQRACQHDARDGLEQAGTEGSVNLQGCVDDGAGDAVE